MGNGSKGERFLRPLCFFPCPLTPPGRPAPLITLPYPHADLEEPLNAPAWRVWLVVALMCGWGILTIRFVQKGNVPFALLCALLLISNGVTLWRLTKKDR